MLETFTEYKIYKHCTSHKLTLFLIAYIMTDDVSVNRFTAKISFKSVYQIEFNTARVKVNSFSTYHLVT